MQNCDDLVYMYVDEHTISFVCHDEHMQCQYTAALKGSLVLDADAAAAQSMILQYECKIPRNCLQTFESALQFARLAEKITELEAAEENRSLQLQPLIQKHPARHTEPPAAISYEAAREGNLSCQHCQTAHDFMQ